MTFSRRELGLLLPALTAAAAAAQDKKSLPSKVYKFEDLPVHQSGPNTSRAVFDGVNRAGVHIDLHMTELAAGQTPHLSHHHEHEELVMLQTGTLDATIEGQTTHVTAGSVIYVASNQEHGWRNPGPGKSQYFVIALGRAVS